ncbi:MAG: precorrin-6y C5,15-methyltransferase (decarboxylating) subunit CbiE [Nitrospirota bacterium]
MDKKVVIVGCGPGAPDLLTIRGKAAIEEADVVVGPKRLLSDFVQTKHVTTMVLENNYQDIFGEVDRIKEDRKVVFLVSGDPLFHSFGESIVERLGRENCEVIPGVSSFQYLFCKLKESWKAYSIFSLHGAKEIDIKKIFIENNRFILLLDPKHNLRFVKSKIRSITLHKYTFYVASRLSMPDEKISKISFDDFDKVKEESLSILIVLVHDE